MELSSAPAAKIAEPMVSGDWQLFMPNIKPGEIAASPLNPICWPVDDK